MENSPKGTTLLRHTELVIVWPDGKKQVYPILEKIVRVGRGKENNDIPIPPDFTSISRRHFEIRQEGDNYRIVDLGSTNGVYINNQVVEEALLKHEDEIRIGLADQNQEIRFQFQLGTEYLAKQILPKDATSPTVGLTVDSPADSAYLRLRFSNGEVSFFSIQKNVLVVGRNADADLSLNYPFISGRHFELRQDGNQFTITDLKSTNGTLLNNETLPANAPTPIHNNAIIRIGDDSFGISLGLTFFNPLEPQSPSEGFMMSSPPTRIEQTRSMVIGRAEDVDIHFDSQDVSRHHAALTKQGQDYILEDLGSVNGTFVNDQPIRTAALRDGDLIRIGSFLLVFANGQVTPYQSTGMRMDVRNLNQEVRTRRGKLRILDDINLSILPREFVAIVGGSGAGKSTLLNALIGYRPGQGKVQLNGQDFYAEYERYRSQLGFVPQNDILHTSLTVERGLDYAARLRLPGSLSHAERKRRIEAVLETVSMNTEILRKTRIADLSGGQRKRVSIAAELLADPKLIFLDEATSGLDPGLEKKLMHTLRQMADEGRTVVLITHATSNIVQTDHVAFLSQGKLIYFGPSQETLDFFEVEDFADIYERIEHNGEKWRRVFLDGKPAQHQKYVAARQATLGAIPQHILPTPRFGLADFLRQLLTLTQRNFSVLLSDPITMALLLLLLPVTAFLQLVIAKPDVLTGNLAILADPVAAAKTMLEAYIPLPRTNTFVFVMGLNAVLVGLYVPPNELIHERAIYLRERTVNLKVLPYLLSKVLIYTIFAAIQIILYMLIVSRGVNFPERGVYFNGTLEIFISIFLTMMAGIGTGMIVAAVSRSTDIAIYILVMLLFFQFYFAGTIFDLRGNKFEAISYITATRWSLNALGVTIDMKGMAESTILCNDVPENPFDPNSAKKTICFNYPEASKDLMLDYATENLVRSWMVLIVMTIITIGITGLLLKRMDPAT